MKLSRKQTLKMDGAKRREDTLAAGASLLPRNKVHKKKTDWTRRPKHKKIDPDFEE